MAWHGRRHGARESGRSRLRCRAEKQHNDVHLDAASARQRVRQSGAGLEVLESVQE